MISPNLSAIFYLISGVLFILALRGLSSPETSRQGNFFGISGIGTKIGARIRSVAKVIGARELLSGNITSF